MRHKQEAQAGGISRKHKQRAQAVDTSSNLRFHWTLGFAHNALDKPSSKPLALTPGCACQALGLVYWTLGFARGAVDKPSSKLLILTSSFTLSILCTLTLRKRLLRILSSLSLKQDATRFPNSQI